MRVMCMSRLSASEIYIELITVSNLNRVHRIDNDKLENTVIMTAQASQFVGT
jgi:hypothetical protein